MNSYIEKQLDQIHKTKVIEIKINNDNYFGNGSIKVCNIQVINTKYQFIICNTDKLQNKLIFRYFNKVWSDYYLELNFINDSKVLFDLNYQILKSNKHYNLLLKNYIKSIKLFKDNKLLINNKETRKEL